jgi:hypothetical protein
MIEETKIKTPEKCIQCDMPEKYRPEHPGCCGVCFQNAKLEERKENGNN